MVTHPPPPVPVTPEFPGCVPVLGDPAGTVVLRAHRPGDAEDIVEACRDPETIRWTTVPAPDGGYSLGDAHGFLEMVAAGWASGARRSWAIEAERSGRARFCGSIDLVEDGPGRYSVGFLLHPAARGRSLVSAALRLVRDHALDTAGYQAIQWRALTGNWGSRRAAAAAGFVFDGTVRRLLPHRGTLRDAWVATITAHDPRESLVWADPPVLLGERVRLRPFTDDDAERIVQACSDPRTRHWLVSLPRPYAVGDARDFIEATREQAARRTGLFWCITDPDDDRYLGSVSLEGLGGYSRRAEIGYLAHPAARGRGLMTAAVRSVTAYAEQQAGVDSIVIRCAAGNLASQHVARSAGYRQAGVLAAAEPVGDGGLDDLVLHSRP